MVLQIIYCLLPIHKLAKADLKLSKDNIMPKIPDEVVKRVIDLAKIEDVVGDFVTLRKAGVNLTGLCPFHDDKNDGNFIVRPSTVSAKRGGNTYHCFVCMRRGEGGGPVDFLMKHERMTFPDAIRWLGKKYSEPVDDVPVNYTPPPPKPAPPPLPRLTFKRVTVKESMKGIEQTLFVKWLRSLPWDDEQRARLSDVLRSYCVATCPHGPEWIAFWQITHDSVPLTAKYMKYKPDGHRVKDRDQQGNKVFASDWEHAWRARQNQYDPDKWEVHYALFGEHLLKRYPNAVVNVVESEKTAIIMANYYDDFDSQIWLACGGLQWLQLDKFQPIIDQGRTIWLWPDKDGREAWQEVADKLGYDKCQVYTRFFDTCWTEADGDKADVADIAIRMMRNPEFKPRETPKVGGGYITPCDSLPLTPEQREQLGIQEWVTVHGDEPFIDPLELQDPRVRKWREIFRKRYNFNKTRNNGRNETENDGA